MSSPRLHKGAVVHDGSIVEAGGMTCAKSPNPINQQAQLVYLIKRTKMHLKRGHEIN
jgi:hypothetical protein